MSRVVAGALVCLAVATPAVAQITRISVSTAGVEADAPSGSPSVSANGRFVVFESMATNLVAGDTNGALDVFLRDRDTDADGILDEPGAVATTRISVGAGGAQLDDASYEASITPNGRYVVFTSKATNLLPGATTVPQVYRLDRTTNTVVRVSAAPDGTAGNGISYGASVSADGNLVLFFSGVLLVV